MCGISGRLICRHANSKKLTEEQEKAILCSMERRGPDDNGMYDAGNIQLFHARLSVMDPENGRQPMYCKMGSRRYVIVYNGELYNTDEIRQELKNLGYVFETSCDTEVVLKAYICWGEQALGRMNGIFSFAVWEEGREKLFFARDRMGVKPFFYRMKSETNRSFCGEFLFSSEIKTLFCYPDSEAVLDESGISELILIGPGRTPGCGVFNGIVELKPGCCGTIDREGNYDIHLYWHVKDKKNEESFESTVHHVADLVRDAIERQLVSDVPIGTFLSGGLDSSLISSVASHVLKQQGKRLQTFSVTYRDNMKYFVRSGFQPDSDDEYIGEMAKYLGSDHETYTVDMEDLVPALYQAVDARDLPGMADVDASLLLFCREIRKKVKVALSGECADELFGGYPWYRDENIRNTPGFPWSRETDYRAGFLTDDYAGKIDCNSYVKSRYESTVSHAPKSPGLDERESRMREMVCLNQDWFMQTLLDRKDRMSMYSGLEVRVPFCDYRIVEYLYSTSWEKKDYLGREKGLLREAMKDWLPDRVLWRKKSPYPKTHNPMYFSMVKDEMQKMLIRNDSPILQFVKKSALEQLIIDNQYLPWYGQLMNKPQTIAYFLQMDYWMRKYNVRVKH